jgi:4-amino-4-deoxy-L-arabinose transferase-like glycosyltransferase
MRPQPFLNMILLVQGIFYLVTGLWPLFSINTFQKVTGPKQDLWLVRTVGVLITVISVVLIIGGKQRKVNDEIPLLAVGSAVGLTAIDVVYVSKGRISPIYLLDAIAELILATGVILAWLPQRSRRKRKVET